MGEMRADIRNAQLRSLIINIVRQLYPEKGVEPVMSTPAELMTDWGGDKPEPPQQSVEEQKRILFGIARHQKKKAEREKLIKERSKPPRKYRKK